MSFLTPKELERLAKVRKQLAAGINPYAQIVTLRPVVYNAERIIREQSETEIQALESKWGAREPEGDTSLDIDLGPTENRLPGVLYCSFCDQRVDQINATFGIGPLQKIAKEEIKRIGNMKWIEEKIVHFTDKLIACPDCALKIKRGTVFTSLE